MSLEPALKPAEHVEHVEHDDDDDHGHAVHEEGEEGEGPWLMSFADMVTLLMCFFILFFQVEKSTGKFQEPQRELKRLKALLGTSAEVDSPVADQPRPTDEQSDDSSIDVVLALGSSEPNTVEIVMLSTNMFPPGRAELTADGRVATTSVATQLKVLPKDATIEVEGHTDSEPVRGGPFKDNWDLSAARAANVVRALSEQGVDPHRMRAAGLAHFQPLLPEKDARGFSIISNMAMNRRVVVKVRTPAKTATKPTPPGEKKAKS